MENTKLIKQPELFPQAPSSVFSHRLDGLPFIDSIRGEASERQLECANRVCRLAGWSLSRDFDGQGRKAKIFNVSEIGRPADQFLQRVRLEGRRSTKFVLVLESTDRLSKEPLTDSLLMNLALELYPSLQRGDRKYTRREWIKISCSWGLTSSGQQKHLRIAQLQ